MKISAWRKMAARNGSGVAAAKSMAASKR